MNCACEAAAPPGDLLSIGAVMTLPLALQDTPVKLAIVMKVIGRTGSRGQVRFINPPPPARPRGGTQPDPTIHHSSDSSIWSIREETRNGEEHSAMTTAGTAPCS